jgi:hypothetical protein
MTALSAPNAALWRTSPYRYTGYLYVDKPEVVFAARINQASFTYPLAQVTFDTVTVGAFGDILPGFTVLFGSSAGADDLGRQRARKAATSTILYVGESSQGDHDGEVDLADNGYITVLNERRLWGIPPRFGKSSATAFKDYEIEVDSGGRNYASHPGPKANGGAWRVALIDPVTEVATFDFADESIYVTPDSVFDDRLWDVGDGTITVGTDTDEEITVEFPLGRRYVSLTVTDDNGHSHTHYILVVALDTTDAAWKPTQQFEIADQRFTQAGGEMSVVIHEDIPASTYYDGVAVLYFESEIFGTTAGSLAGPATLEHVKFVGWLDAERESPAATLSGIQRGTELRCISAAERLRQINLLPQLMKFKNSPDAWDEMAELTNARVLWYLLRWHSTVLELCNLYLTENVWDSVIKRWATTASTLYDQAVEAAKARAQLFTCDRRSTLRLVQNSLILSDSTGERSDIDIIALTEADAISVSLERNRMPSTYWIDGSAITIGTDTEDIIPMFSRAPGNAPGQGAQRTSFAGLIVDGQDELNIWTGNEYARINAPWLPVRINMKYPGDAGIDPALGEWITLTLPSTTNRRARAFTAQRFMPIEVSIRHNNDPARTREVEITAVIETSGAPAETVSIPKGGANITIYGTVNDSVGFTAPPISPGGGPGSYQLYKGQHVMAAWSADGYVHLTANYNDTEPQWDSVNLGLVGGLDDFVVDAFSPKYLGTGDEVNGWAVTRFFIYRIEDVFDVGSGRTITSQTSVLQASLITQIDSPFGASGYAAVSVHFAGDGNYVYHTEDGGATWDIDPIGDEPGDNSGITDLHYCTRIAGRIYTVGFDSPGDGDLYRSDDHGVTWTKVTTDGDLKYISSVHVPWHDNPNADLVYYSGQIAGNVEKLFRVRIGNAREDITPFDGIRPLMAFQHWGFTAHVNNRQRMAMMGTSESAPANNILVTSLDGGDSWTIKQSGTPYRAAFIAGDDGNTLHLWGRDGALGCSQDFGLTVQDKRGNLAASPPGNIVRICGG